jgi:hypothetical protein
MLKNIFPIVSGIMIFQYEYRIIPIEITIKSFEKGETPP